MTYLKEECGYCRWCRPSTYRPETRGICEKSSCLVNYEDTCDKWEAYDE